MKKMILAATIFLIAWKAFPQKNDTINNFTIKGMLRGSYAGMLYLAYTDNKNNYTLDSTILKNGSFTFAGHIPGKTVAWFKAKTKFRIRENMVVDSLKAVLLPGQTVTALLYSEDAK